MLNRKPCLADKSFFPPASIKPITTRRYTMSYYDNILEIDSNLDGSGLCIGIVMSRFNIDVSEGLLGTCTSELIQLGVLEADIVLVTVPGALEIPIALQK